MAKLAQVSKVLDQSAIIHSQSNDTIRLWEGHREQATLWRAIALLQLPTTFLAILFALTIWKTRSITLNVPQKPLPGTYLAQDIPDSEFVDYATNYINLIATYQPAIVRRQFDLARSMIWGKMLEVFDDEMLGRELRAIETTARTQIFFADPTHTEIEREGRMVTVHISGDRYKRIGSKDLPLAHTTYEVVMTTIPRNTFNPYGIVIKSVSAGDNDGKFRRSNSNDKAGKKEKKKRKEEIRADIVERASMRAKTIDKLVIAAAAAIAILPAWALARDIEFGAGSGEIEIFVSPNEPTQVQFPGKIAGGFKKKNSALSLDKQLQDLIVFATQPVGAKGEAFIIRLEDGRSYSLRVKHANPDSPRDNFVTVFDKRGSIISSPDNEELPAHKERFNRYAPATKVSGLMREMMLVAELGKSGVSGYKRSEKYKGQVVLNDGTILATIDSIFIGSNLWGYVIDAKNLLDQTQRINPATFRLDGTRAISASRWELAPRPLNVEQQIAGQDGTKIYIITRSRD